MGRPKKTTNPTQAEPGAQQAAPAAAANDNGPSISKAEAVRQALAEGLSSPGDIADCAKAKHGLDIPKPQVSAYRAQNKAKGTAPKATRGRTPLQLSLVPQFAVEPR